MMKSNQLTALKVQRIKGAGYYSDGQGLYLQVASSGAKSWIVKYRSLDTLTASGKQTKKREMGLGSARDISLAEARDKAAECRKQLANDVDPIKARHADRTLKRAAGKTFKECATSYIAAKSIGWKNEKHKKQWQATLDAYAHPLIGPLMIRDIEVEHVLRVLQQPTSAQDQRPIWQTRTETASRLRGRVEAVLDWAKTLKYRSGDNPARWKGHLDKILAAPTDIATVEHHEAVALDDAAQFMSNLREQAGMGALALQFVILTAARSGEVRGALWSEIDMDAGMWVVPASRTKTEKEHRVPLCGAAVKLLKSLPRSDDVDLVFPSPTGKQLSDMTLSAVMRRMGVDAVPHGWRSTFRDWSGERTSYPGEMAELALGHAIGDKVEAAYRRGDMFEKRRRMMNDWAKFLDTPLKPGKVLPMKKRAA